MLKTNYESNACLLLETDLRWLLWRLGPLGRALKSGLWPVIRNAAYVLAVYLGVIVKRHVQAALKGEIARRLTQTQGKNIRPI